MGTKTVIFDIDGTLADVTHRRHHVAAKPKNWPAFFAGMDRDPPVRDVVEFCRFILAQRAINNTPRFKVVFCSGRGEEHRRVTEDWLIEHVWPFMLRSPSDYLKFPDDMYLDLRMRPARDNRPDDIIKKEMLDRLRAEGHDIWFVVDDRQRVVDMWRANGVTVFQCAPGDFDSAEPWAYEPKPGERLLSLMVGPSGAGKTSHLICQGFADSRVISSDKVRAEMLGDFRDQSQNARVFAYVHDLAKTRLRYGLPVIIDATHLHKRDRLASVALAPPGTIIEYVVIDRPLDQKLRDGGWRLDVIKDGETLVERHHKSMQGALKDILNGDDLSSVVVTDLRTTKEKT
jgi:predicted kinase